MARTPKKAVEQRPGWMKSPGLVKFIAEFEKHGNASKALKAASLARSWVYAKRREDTDFALAFDEARKCGLEVLKDEAHRRAYEGIDKPVYYQGEEVAVLKEYSDTLLMFLIKQHDPSYREHFDVSLANTGGRPFMFQMMLHPDAAKASK